MQTIIIVGFGFMGGMHAQAYSKIAKARLTAAVDANVKAAAAALKQLGISVPVYRDLREALTRHPADVIDICLPTPLHGKFVRQALKAGRHVFCEKPFTANAAEAFKLAELAEKSGRSVQVGQCIRFWPEYEAFVEFVKSRKAGKLLSLTLQRRAGRPGYSMGDWLNKGKQSGGAALDLHVHDTDFVHHLLGCPKAVTSVGTKDKTGWSHIFTTYHFDEIAVTAEGGWNYPPHWGFQMAFQAIFEKGTVEFDSTVNPSLKLTLGTQAKRPLAFRVPSAGSSGSGAGNISSLGGYYNELAYFVGRLEKGRKPALATPRQAAESVRTVLAEIKSASTGRTVRL